MTNNKESLFSINLPKKRIRERISTLILVSLCLLGIIFVYHLLKNTPVHGPYSSGLVINEVMTSNRYALSDDIDGTPDWIELYNASDSDINLAGYSLTNNVKDFRKYVFPNVTLRKHGYLLLYASNNEQESNESRLCTGFNLSRTGEFLFLSDSYAGLVQQLEVPELLNDVSYARMRSGSYGFSCNSTPGESNDDSSIVESLSLLTNAETGSLMISELMPFGIDGRSWIELYNPSEGAIQISDYYLSDKPNNPQRDRLPDYVLKPKGYVLIYFTTSSISGGKEDYLIANFGISKEDTVLQLSNADGSLADVFIWETGFPKGLSLIRTGGDLRVSIPTPLAENSGANWIYRAPKEMDESDPIVVNEIMPANNGIFSDQAGDSPEWVELTNRSGSAVSLSGYYISDDLDAPARYALPDVTIEPNAFLVVWLSGKSTASVEEIHANFRLSSGESLVLTDFSKMRQQMIAIEDSCPINCSFSKSADGSLVYYGTPTPGFRNAKPYTEPSQVGWFSSDSVIISEVCAYSNSDQSEWVELYNGSSSSVSLDGWHLTDKCFVSTGLDLNGITLSPGEYIRIPTSSDKDSTKSFGISSAGETIFLLKPDGNPADIFQTGLLHDGITSGRDVFDKSTARVFFMAPTPGKANSTTKYDGISPSPILSNTDLYHEAPFVLQLSTSSDQAVIYYTLDGSEPTKKSKLYGEGIEIAKDCVIRATAFQDGLLPSASASATYLFSRRHSIPVVCIVADPENLTPVLKTTQRINKPECLSELTYFDEFGELCVRFPAGLRAKGRSMLKYTQKSFSVKLRGRYGQSSISYPFFEDSSILTYSAFSLRNGGQDRSRSRLRDSYYSRLAEDLSIDNIKTRIVAVYLNGKFYGIYDLNEEQDESFLASHYGVDADAVDIINRNDEVKEGSADEFLRVRAFALNEDLSDDSVYTKFCEWIDVDYFTDYLVFRSYIADTDMINQAYWRSQDYSVKWRPILFDLDYGLYGNQYQQSYEKDVLSYYFDEDGIPSANKTKTYMDIYIGLKKNAGWRKKLVERYVELMHTTLSVENMLALLDEMDDDYIAEMPFQVALVRFPASNDNIVLGLEQLRDAIRMRPDYAIKYLKLNFPAEAEYIDELLEKYK